MKEGPDGSVEFSMNSKADMFEIEMRRQNETQGYWEFMMAPGVVGVFVAGKLVDGMSPADAERIGRCMLRAADQAANMKE